MTVFEMKAYKHGARDWTKSTSQKDGILSARIFMKSTTRFARLRLVGQKPHSCFNFSEPKGNETPKPPIVPSEGRIWGIRNIPNSGNTKEMFCPSAANVLRWDLERYLNSCDHWNWSLSILRGCGQYSTMFFEAFASPLFSMRTAWSRKYISVRSTMFGGWRKWPDANETNTLYPAENSLRDLKLGRITVLLWFHNVRRHRPEQNTKNTKLRDR
jgi:hypothetical protein